MIVDSINKASQQVIKESNLNLVFNLIHMHQPISRADIKKITKLSATTISSLCEELLGEGLILETGMGEGSSSGRKPIMLEVNDKGGCFVSVELLVSSLLLHIYDLGFGLLISKMVKRNPSQSLGNEIVQLIQSALSEKEIKHKVLGITIGAAAVISDDRGHIASSTVIDVESHDEFMDTVKFAFPSVLAVLENTSCLVAYAEKKAAHMSVKNLISVDIGDGVGAGIVVDGKIYTGSHGLAGEFGHTTIDYRGKQCKCGGLGCLELYTTIPAILSKVDENIKNGAKSAHYEHTIDTVRQSLETEGGAERLAVEETALQLSFGIVNLINIVDPEMIVISGGIERLGNFFLDCLKNCISKKCLSKAHEAIPIKYSQINGNTVSIGGVKYAFDVLFSNE